MYLKIGERVRLINDVVSSFYDRGEIHVSGTKGSIAIILSPAEFLLYEPYKHMYTQAEITRMMLDGKWYPIRYEQIVPLMTVPSDGFEVIDQCRAGGVDLISVRLLERLKDEAA